MSTYICKLFISSVVVIDNYFIMDIIFMLSYSSCCHQLNEQMAVQLHRGVVRILKDVYFTSAAVGYLLCISFKMRVFNARDARAHAIVHDK